MSNVYIPRPSILQITHATVFSAGLVALLIGAFSNHAIWYVIAGSCLAVSGGSILLGFRLTFRGPFGDALRAALGPSRVRRLSLRAVFWVLAGLLISVWGIKRLQVEREERPLQEPLAVVATHQPIVSSS